MPAGRLSGNGHPASAFPQRALWGSTYWQVNDTYLTMSLATIDYYGRWKGAHYIVKRSYQPFIAYAEPDKATGEMVVYAS